MAKCGGGAVTVGGTGGPCIGPARGRQPAFVLTPDARDPGRRFTAADAASLARLGFNVVRLGIVWEGLEPGPRGVGPNNSRYCSAHPTGAPYPRLGAADPYDARVLNAYLAKTDLIVKLLADVGIRVVIDMHQDVYSSVFSNRAGPTPWNGEGAPPWATCTAPARFLHPQKWGPGYIDPAVKVAIHHFFANDVSGDLQGQFDRVWSAVARHFRGDPRVIGYELYNEPEDFSLGEATFSAELQCFYGGPAHEPASCADSGSQAPADGAIGSIQAADPRHIVIYEPPVVTDNDHPDTIGISEPLRFHRLALAFHAYSSQQSALLELIAQNRAATRTLQPGGPPWLMDEFGGNRHALSAGRTAALADRANLSWSYWSALELHDPTGNPDEGLLDERTARPFTAKARALTVAYPAATAGTPGPWSYDRSTGRFDYAYTVSPTIHAPTEVELAPNAYPNGYRVRVRGARVVSAASSSVLELRARPGARTVAVAVRRR